MKSTRYLVAVLALPVLGGTAVAAATVAPTRPVEVAAGTAVNPDAANPDAASPDVDSPDAVDPDATEPKNEPDEAAAGAEAVEDAADDETEAEAGEDAEVGPQEPPEPALTEDEWVAQLSPEELAEMEAYEAFWDAGYNYQQLLALADYWALDQFGAKAKAGSLILDGDQAFVDAALDDIGTIPAPVEPVEVGDWNPTDDDIDAFAAYWDAGYQYDQLLSLAAYWDLSEFDAKVKAGNLVRDGNQSVLDDIFDAIDVPEVVDDSSDVSDADLAAVDAFFDAGYSFGQAVELSEVWGLDSWDAKIKAGTFVINGQQADRVDAVLASIG